MKNISDDHVERTVSDFNSHMRIQLDKMIESLTSKRTAHSDEKDITEPHHFFILNNHMLCLIEYNECFTVLYRKARLGDYEAMKKLLRIDPILFNDHWMNKRFIKAKPTVSRQLMAAYNNPLKYHTKALKVKVSMCGFLSAYSEVSSGDVMRPSELRALLRAFYEDVCNESADEQLQDEPDAFRIE